MMPVFVEGVSGTGKSTTAAKLRDRLAGAGYAVECFLEGDASSPIGMFWRACLSKAEHSDLYTEYAEFADEIAKNTIFGDDYCLVLYRGFDKPPYPPELFEFLQARDLCFRPQNPFPYELFSRIFHERWHAFVNSDLTKMDYIIFDGAMQHQTNDMLRNYSAKDDEIALHLKSLLNVAQAYNPVIFYLHSRDVRQRLRDARAKRGQKAADEATYAFWENRKRVDMLVLDKLSVVVHKIEIVTGDFEEYGEIADRIAACITV